jgi:hypothetical protein
VIAPKWLQGAVDEKEIQKRKDLVGNSRELLTLLNKVIQEEIIRLSSTSFEDYNDAGWPYREADRKGQIRSLKNIQVLCTI